METLSVFVCSFANRYDDRNNFMPLCSGKMKGQTQSLSGNVYLFPQWEGQCLHVIGGMSPGNPFFFHNNTCVNDKPAIFSGASPLDTLVSAGNTYYVPGGM